MFRSSAEPETNGSTRRMFQMVQFLVPSGPKRPNSSSGSKPKPTLTTADQFIQRVRAVTGLRQQDVFHNLRVPNQQQTDRDEISLLLLTGYGVFCIDLKTWSGSVSAQSDSLWPLQSKEQQKHTHTHTSTEELPDALQQIRVKAGNLCAHLRRCGLHLPSSLCVPRVLLLSECVLSDALLQDELLVSHTHIEPFLRSLTEGYASWLTHTLTPAWITGQLSYSQMRAVREQLELIGSWDVLQMIDGQQISGDFQSCRHLSISRQETDLLEFSPTGSLVSDTLWSLLGHTPQVTVSLYKRGPQGWLGKPIIATATIPSSTRVIFRMRGDATESRIPCGRIRSITLSI